MAINKWRPYYRIRAQADNSAEILLYDPIGEDTWGNGVGAKNFMQDLKALGPVRNITLRINSPGGSVFEGLTIYNALKAHPADVTVVIDGLAASIASVVAMAGDTVIMPENALLMIHDPGALALGNADEMRKMADILDKTKESLVTAYRNKTGLSDNEIADLMSEETWMNAREAVKLGFADEIAESARMAAHFDLSKFKNVPRHLRKDNGGLNKMEDKDIHDDTWKRDKYEERARVTALIEIGKEFKCPELANSYITSGGSEEDLRLELLKRMKSDNRDQPIITVESRGAAKPFNSFGDFLTSVKAAGTPGSKTDPRLFYNAASGSNEATSSEGGFLVQTDFSTRLLERTYEQSILAPRCSHIPISGGANGVKLPIVDETSRVTGSRWGGVQMYWSGEAGTVGTKKPKFAELELSLHKLMGISYATDELLADSSALEAVTTAAFTSEASYTIDSTIISGDGAGKPLGITASNAVITVSKETGQLANTVQYENIVNMWARLWAQGERNAVWLINRDVIPQLFTMTLGTGATTQPVYIPPTGASGSPYGTIFGRPVISMEQCSTLGTAGDIMLVDPSQYILADKGGLTTQMSIHVRFVYDESCFRFTYRVDGQPAWKAPLTPASGSANTLSPFVMLQSRT